MRHVVAARLRREVPLFVAHRQIASPRPGPRLAGAVAEADLVQHLRNAVDEDSPAHHACTVPGVFDEQHLDAAPVDGGPRAGVAGPVCQVDARIHRQAASIRAHHDRHAEGVGSRRVPLLEEAAIAVIEEADPLNLAGEGGAEIHGGRHEHGLAGLVAMIRPRLADGGITRRGRHAHADATIAREMRDGCRSQRQAFPAQRLRAVFEIGVVDVLLPGGLEPP